MRVREYVRLLRFPFLRLVRCAAALGRDRSGAVAIFIGAAIIPLIGALGLATDAARGYMVKARLSQALDAAALAGGKVIFSDHRDQDVEMFFDANFPPGFMGATVDGPHIDVQKNTYITVWAEATIPTTFMRVLGFETLTVSASTEVTRIVDQLDVVLSIDMSGSMCQPCTKIEAAREAATTLVDILFGTNPDGTERTESPTTEINGKAYDLLNIGLVTWNAEVNVTLNGESYTGSTSETVSSFTNPVTGDSQTRIYYANNSPVPLLMDPDDLDGGWSGCVYARYIGDFDDANGDGDQDWGEGSINDNDADLSLGAVTLGSGDHVKEWLGWEPAGNYEGENRSGWWNYRDDMPSDSDWYGDYRQCYQSYWNDGDSDQPPYPPVRPVPPGWTPAVPNIWTYSDCGSCLSHGITALQTQKAPIIDAIESFTSPEGNTNIPQGLFWAWEVLMPGEPFDEALETVPFPRQRAIVLLTDGEIRGGNGDAYKGRFGNAAEAATTTRWQHGYLPSPPAEANTRNNLNNRLLQLASNIKQQGVKIYVIQFAEDSSTLMNLLKKVASTPQAPHYYFAPDEEALRQAFKEIANNLSTLRLSK